MGEAKRRAERAVETVYHHTSTLRTNLIWMSGVIELEGRSKGAIHPQLGEIQTDISARRACKDFPPLAWFSSSIRVPRCLLDAGFMLRTKDGRAVETDAFNGLNKRALSNSVALNRVAIGFSLAENPIVAWKEHFGYNTAEGRELNETAREAGDDPDSWFVSEQPVDVASATEIWIAPRIFDPKLKLQKSYLADVHRMVQLCRDNPGVYIPPSWLTPAEAERLAASMASSGVEVRSLPPASESN